MSPEEIKRIAELMAQPAERPEYRLHYNEMGDIVACSMVGHPDSTRYVVVDRKTYDDYNKYRIEEGQLVLINVDASYSSKLKKFNSGNQVVKNHAGLLLESGETYNDTEYYAYRNN